MSRLNIIILDRPQDDVNSYRYALWADVPAARQSFYADAAAKSAWASATTADNTALQSGAVVEKVDLLRVPQGATLAQIESFLQTRWTNYQNAITAANPWIRYGSTWDGTTWTVVTGA